MTAESFYKIGYLCINLMLKTGHLNVLSIVIKKENKLKKITIYVKNENLLVLASEAPPTAHRASDVFCTVSGDEL